MSDSGTPQWAVYTVLLGGYETLNERQHQGDGSVPFICFTDDRALTSDVWDIRIVTPMFTQDLQRSQRELKIRGHADLAKFERTLYIDNSVSLLAPPNQVLAAWLDGHDFAIPQHSFRPTVLDEFMAVIEIGLDDPARVYEQLYHYSEDHRSVLSEKPLWNAMIARRNTPKVGTLFERWFDEVLRYSRRDQLSANVILGQTDLSLNRVDIDNHHSAIHQWPMPVGRTNTLNRQAKAKVMPDIARIRELETLLAAQLQRADAGDRLLNELQETQSWRIAQRISKLANSVRPRAGAKGKRKE